MQTAKYTGITDKISREYYISGAGTLTSQELLEGYLVSNVVLTFQAYDKTGITIIYRNTSNKNIWQETYTLYKNQNAIVHIRHQNFLIQVDGKCKVIAYYLQRQS